MSELAKTGGLPSNIANMASALAAAVVTSGQAGGSDLYMIFTKFGEWVYGAEKQEVEEDSIWALNTDAIGHGWIAWDQDNTSNGPTGEMMVSAALASPLESSLPQVKGSWAKCISFSMVCTDGEDVGTQVLWKSSSLGARKEWSRVIQLIIERAALIEAGDAPAGSGYPLVKLAPDSYVHKTYGKTYTPVIEVVGWVTKDGMPGTSEEKPEAVEKQAAEPAAEKQAEEPAPVKEEEEPTRRRRRKAS
jgi:hypothetical protein